MSRGGIRKDTNSNNPNAIKARVFIGNLNNEKCTQVDLEKAFGQFGKITGCSVHKNFGFVQYDTEKAARDMVTEWNGKSFAGKRIDCNIADERRKPQQKDFSPGGNRPRPRSPPRNRPISPRQRPRSRSPHGRSRERPPPGMFGRREDRPSRFSGGDDDNYGSYETRYPTSDRPREHSFDRSRDRYERDSFDRKDYSYGSGFSGSADGGYGNDGYAEQSQSQSFAEPGVDCEIIVLSKDQRGYGELVEDRLRRIGVNSKLVFPRPDIRVVDVIERVAKNGSLYSIVLSAQNEMHHSCTLNIMHGTRQEHRNMPLEDALAFVAKNFEQYLRERDGGGGGSSFQTHDYQKSSGASGSKSDPNIAELLVAAAAGKPLDDSQIAKLASELKKRNAGNDHGGSGQVSNQEKQNNLQSLVHKVLGRPKEDTGKGEGYSIQNTTHSYHASPVGSSPHSSSSWLRQPTDFNSTHSYGPSNQAPTRQGFDRF